MTAGLAELSVAELARALRKRQTSAVEVVEAKPIAVPSETAPAGTTADGPPAAGTPGPASPAPQATAEPVRSAAPSSQAAPTGPSGGLPDLSLASISAIG